ncbi:MULTISPECIES: hypothetical protein [Bacillus cereus group]|uniref:Uncharacterized protein n=1 Tax=Bacillus cereus TaxID=1396 RepID=A0AA44QBB8_BACCE|nr:MULTISPECIES: hypothetical protein [Bacillus cereus group]PFA22549.1 hypothetical protein CN373_09920 [Bacillus cereus]PFN06503.1 hypothetical protein COJ55_14070 [Bacillus cereus]PFO84908.1 hypothetical protein COJ77_03495 [Bacillus cereus]PFR24174.1 hypothetical protein COK19_18625 [Bacillus cereus]PFS01881.1 hypothetical protein COK38_10435 [Bacillus cereus]
MHPLKKAILYIFSFIFYPIGIIAWVISLFSKDPEKRKTGRVCVYPALTGSNTPTSKFGVSNVQL